MKILTPIDIRSIPKVELHRHLDCSMRWSTFCELAPQVGIEMPTDPALRRVPFLITEPMLNLDSVLKKFHSSQKVLASEQILSRLAEEACEDAYNDGILILELRYAPTFIAEGHPQLSFEKIHLAFLKGIESAQKKWPIAVGLICIVQRIKSLKENARVIEFAIEHKNSFIGIDLADSEESFEPQAFSSLFQKAKSHGLHVTVHSGETPHPHAGQRIRDSIEKLGAERIGHGVQAIRDLSTIDFLRTHKIPLEVCPWSNYLTQAFPQLKDHPLRQLWNAGLLLTLNSDDPGIFNSLLSDDYLIAHQIHGFQSIDFDRLNDIAASSSFIPFEKKQKVWPRPILEINSA